MDYGNGSGEPGNGAGTIFALLGLIAGAFAIFWWVVRPGGWTLDILVPPLAGALVGWALWKLEYGLPLNLRPLPLRVRRFPPDLPRGDD